VPPLGYFIIVKLPKKSIAMEFVIALSVNRLTAVWMTRDSMLDSLH
jgi:hypothetical protein